MPRVRLGNFTDIDLAGRETLSLGGHAWEEVVAQVRRHADLPYVYIAGASQWELVSRVLERLRAMRSPCYPRAVLLLGSADPVAQVPDVEVFTGVARDPRAIGSAIDAYVRSSLCFDLGKLRKRNSAPLPGSVDVLIVGAGVTGLTAARKMREIGLSFCVLEERPEVGGIWSSYANATSQVNTSEGAYRLLEHRTRSNRDHSPTGEILADLEQLSSQVAGQLYTGARVDGIQKRSDGYSAAVTRDGGVSHLACRGVILAINDRVGTPRTVGWPGQERFRGVVINGFSGEPDGVDWRGRSVVIVGMGAFAVENARTALEAGARHVTVVCRRHGTVCPKIIDYLNFASPYDERFRHDRKSNIRNMMYWKRLYDLSGATQPECWMGKVKHEGHTISVSDIWFVAHHLKKLDTVTGEVDGMFEGGVTVGGRGHIEADIVVKCLGFERNGAAARRICGYQETYNINFVDRRFMYLADAYLDDDVFNSFFGSSVLEMVKFYLEVFAEFFGDGGFEELVSTEGVTRIPLDDRRWSHYIAGAEALIRRYPRVLEIAKTQVRSRTANLLETHDLETYIAENKREWLDTHRLLAGRTLAAEECLPYVFERLVDKNAG